MMKVLYGKEIKKVDGKVSVKRCREYIERELCEWVEWVEEDYDWDDYDMGSEEKFFGCGRWLWVEKVEGDEDIMIGSWEVFCVEKGWVEESVYFLGGE